MCYLFLDSYRSAVYDHRRVSRIGAGRSRPQVVPQQDQSTSGARDVTARSVGVAASASGRQHAGHSHCLCVRHSCAPHSRPCRCSARTRVRTCALVFEVNIFTSVCRNHEPWTGMNFDVFRTRKDTVRCIVMSLTDEGTSELADELVKGGTLQLDQCNLDDCKPSNWREWTPDPVDAHHSMLPRSTHSTCVLL